MLMLPKSDMPGGGPARREDWLERAGLAASMLCLVHCLALPLLFALLPSLIATFSLPESFHLWVLAFAVPASGFALFSGHGRHGAIHPLITGITGLALLAIGVLRFGASPWEMPVTVAGSLCLAFAHIRNWRLRHGAGSHG